MKKLIILIFLLPLLSLNFSGCQPVDVVVPSLAQPSSSTPISEVQKDTVTPGSNPTASSVSGSPTPKKTEDITFSTPEPSKTVTSLSVFEMLSCGEVFCSAAWPGVLSRPIAESYRNTIDPTYPYASTRNGTLEIHTGVEFVNSSGTPVLAVGDGEVVFAGVDDQILVGPYYGFYGNVVVIRHPGLFQGTDIYSLYGHLSEIDVGEGTLINTGDVVGKVGATGYAEGSHLHFEVRIDKNDYEHTVNPIIWFDTQPSSSGEVQAMLAGQILDRQGNPISELTLALERIDDEGNVLQYFYINTYKNAIINSHPELDENFAIPDIPPGNYRLAFVYGKLYELFFTLNPGYLGFVCFQVD